MAQEYIGVPRGRNQNTRKPFQPNGRKGFRVLQESPNNSPGLLSDWRSDYSNVTFRVKTSLPLTTRTV
jgi:hypothetical protein